MMLGITDRLMLLLVGSSLYLVALKANPQLGLLLVLGYHLAVTLMVTTPDPRR